MLTKYLLICFLVVTGSTAHVSPIQEPPVKHQKEYKDVHADGSSYRSSDFVKRDDNFISLPLLKRGDYYTTELFMGSRGERVEVNVTMNKASFWVNDGKSICQNKMKRELQSERDIPGQNPKNSQDVCVKTNNGDDEAKKLKNPMPRFLDMSKRHERECKVWGSFNLAKSKTFKLHPSLHDTMNKNDWWIYAHNGDTNANGVWVSDKVGTSKTMINMIFAVVKMQREVQGFLGIGIPDSTKRRMDGKYTSYPEALMNAGYIKRMAYSLFLNGPDTNGGSILFGAVDHKKYVGKLQTVPMVSVYDGYDTNKLFIVLNKIYLENSNQKVDLLNEPIGAKLDTTGGEQYLPENTLFALVESMSGIYWSERRVYKVDCGYRTTTGNIVYEFSGIKIKVPVSDLVREANGICYLAARSLGNVYNKQYAWLDNSFLRHVYLTVDMQRNEVSMAQAKFSKLEEIEEIRTTVPRAVRAEWYSSTSIASRVTRPKVAKFEIETYKFSRWSASFFQ